MTFAIPTYCPWWPSKRACRTCSKLAIQGSTWWHSSYWKLLKIAISHKIQLHMIGVWVYPRGFPTYPIYGYVEYHGNSFFPAFEGDMFVAWRVVLCIAMLLDTQSERTSERIGSLLVRYRSLPPEPSCGMPHAILILWPYKFHVDWIGANLKKSHTRFRWKFRCTHSCEIWWHSFVQLVMLVLLVNPSFDFHVPG